MDTKKEEAPKTTTISTIAVQSGKTRLVIALLHCGDWMKLKILEVTPELTALGNTISEALELQKAHDEVLRQLQNKQSPVEELLRQADQLIATQKPRAEVYAAMAESLGKAWQDVNVHLELRKVILDLNVQYHTRADEFFAKMEALEGLCSETEIPIDIGAVKDFLTNVHDLRRSGLESLMDALKAGNLLIEKLKELGAEGTLDSRPDRIRSSVNRAISQVQEWMEKLHMKRKVLECTFTRRKEQLEQCLALAILAADLKELEEAVTKWRSLLVSSDELGDSASSAELLQHEMRKLLPDAKQLQERALKITKATDKLVQSGCFAGSQAIEQAYVVLSSTSDYLADLQQRDHLFERVIAFFRSAQSALNKLDQIEMQLKSSELKSTSPQLAQLHAQCAQTIEEVTSGPIAEGYSILGSTPLNASGVRKMVEELENKKIVLDGLCVAHKEENRRINQALEEFLERQDELQGWLVGIAEAFLKGHGDLGHDLFSSREFLDLHNQLLTDLQTKGNEINALLLTLPPILEYLQDSQRSEVDSKVESLHERWLNLKNLLESRLDLSVLYVKFHTDAEKVTREMDVLDEAIQRTGENMSEESMKVLEERLELLVPLYQSAKNTGLTFINETQKVTEPHLDARRAITCVQSVLDRLSSRTLTVNRSWQTFQTEVTERNEIIKQIEINMVESTKTMNWATKLDSQIYPVITTMASDSKEISEHIEKKLQTVVSEIRRAQREVEERVTTTESLLIKTQTKPDERTIHIKEQLNQMAQRLGNICSDYQTLGQRMISYFKRLTDLDNSINICNKPVSRTRNSYEIEMLIDDHEATKQSVLNLFKITRDEAEEIINKIRRQEPSESANQDIERLQANLELRKENFEINWKSKREQLEAQKKLCQFDSDLQQINDTLDDLGHQLSGIRGQYGESLQAAKDTSSGFVHFEKTIEMLEMRIVQFINAGNQLLDDQHLDSPSIEMQIEDLKKRWNELKQQIAETRNLIDLSVQYFGLIEEADDWFREGSRLLVTIARKSSLVKKPEEAQELLNEIEMFLKPGEARQNARIEDIVKLGSKLFGFEPQHVLVSNREMMESFNVISNELNTLAQNLKTAEEERERMLREHEMLRMELLRKEEEKRKELEIRQQMELEAKMREHEELLRKEREQEELRIKKQMELEAKMKREQEELLLQEQLKREQEELLRLEQLKREQEEIKKQMELEAKMKREQEELLRQEQLKREQEELLRLEQMKREQEELLRKEQMIREQEEIKIKKQMELEARMEAPVFITPLCDQIIQEGNKFTFVCQVSGFPLPVVTWHKAGVSIQNNPDYQTTFDQGLCTLTIEETFADDSAKYTCKAINAVGSAETGAFLSVKESEPEEQLSPPNFTKFLQPAVAKEGRSFQFECTVEGNPLPTVQWFKNADCIDNSPDYIITYNNGEAVLKFEQCFMEDKADYTCKASNNLGVAQSVANLVVLPEEPCEPPTFVTPLCNAMARAGEKIKLECEISGLPPPIVLWSHNGKPLKETRDLKLHRDGQKATLSIQEAFPKDAGNYKVTATNLAGEVTSECSVSVKGRLPAETSDSELPSDMEPIKPSIQDPLKNVEIPEGGQVCLECVIVGQPEPEVIWYHDDNPIKESSDFRLLFQGDRCSLIIQEALPEDAGEYKVMALNSAGEASSKALLSVTPKPEDTDCAPKFSKLLTDILVSEGDKVILEAQVSGTPRPDIKWLLNNTPIDQSERIQLAHADDGTLKLDIANVKNEDRGVYTVKATNRKGEAKCFAQLIVKSSKMAEAKVHEEIKSAPTFRETFHDKQVFENTATKFECIVAGKPTPKVRWTFNGAPVSGKNFLISTSGDRQVLSIPEVSKENGGRIECIAENEAGKATCSASLIIQSVSDITLPEMAQSLEIVQIPADNWNKDIQQHTESSFTYKREINVQSSSSTSSKIISSTTATPEPHIEEHKYSSKDEKSFKQINLEAPEIKESHKEEEYHKIGKQEPVIHEKSTSLYTIGGQQVDIPKILPAQETPLPKSIFKARPPKFVTPVIGKIVDQDVNVILEGILDGTPTPQVSWCKNGAEFKGGNNAKVTYEHNCARIELKNVTINDSGKYTCTAINEAGKAISTADLVVRKTIFPPVFGRRLQAQVIKKGDRVNMEVEVTGTPEPQVTWFKDGLPLAEVIKDGYKIKTQGNCHTLVLEKADFRHTGKYTVCAINPGGEAQSIADIAVYEPTPDTMIEVVKTVVFEDVRKHESLASATDKSLETITTSTAEPKAIISKPVSIPSTFPKPLFSESLTTEMSTHTESSIMHDTKTLTLERSTPVCDIEMPKKVTKPDEGTAEGIETSSITKQQSLDFFVKKMKEVEEIPKPKEAAALPAPIKQEIYTKFEDATKIEAPKKVEQTEKYTAFNQSQTSQSYEEFNLQPEPPAEICYPESKPEPQPIIPALEVQQKTQMFEKKSEHFESSQMSKSESSQSHQTWTSERPASAVSSHTLDRQTIIRPTSAMSSSSGLEPSAEGLAMEKTWAHKHTECNVQKSWPPTQKEAQKIAPTWSAQSTLERKWAPETQVSESSYYKETNVSSEITPQATGSFYKETITETLPQVSSSFYKDSKVTSETTPQISSSFYKESKVTSEITPQVSSSFYKESKVVSEPTPQVSSSFYKETKMTSETAPQVSSSFYKESKVTSATESKITSESTPQSSSFYKESKVVSEPTPQVSSSFYSKVTSESTPQVSSSYYKESKVTTESTPQVTGSYYKETKMTSETTPQVPHYIAQVSHTSNVNEFSSQQSSYEMKSEMKSSSKHEMISEERNAKPSEIIKSWPPKGKEPEEVPYKPVVIESLPIRPVSVQDITDEIYLEPGTPPEIVYAQPPVLERRISHVETIEQSLEKTLDRVPSRVLPGAIRTIPPPLPPKQEQPIAPPIPAKTMKPMKVVESKPFEKFPDLEPFPYKPDPDQPRQQRVGPPPTPSKFIKGRFADSDYESDFEAIRIPSKWKPYASDNDEPSFRHVRAPKTSTLPRSRSIEKEAIPPSRFEQPPPVSGLPRPTINFEACKKMLRKETEMKKFTKKPASPPIMIKPGSPPIFDVAEPKSPKTKQKIVIDGYMADTDEPFIMQQKKLLKSEEKHQQQLQQQTYQCQTSLQQQSTQSKFSHHKKHSSTTSASSKKKLVSTPIITSVSTTEKLEPFPFKPEPATAPKVKLPPPPSPSRFVKGEFRESDYESDYESRLSAAWKTDKQFRSVRPVLTPTGRQSQTKERTPTPPMQFDHPERVSIPSRPKFEPIEKPVKTVKLDQIIKPVPKPTPIFKPKPIMQQPPVMDIIIATPAAPEKVMLLQPGTPPEIVFAPGPKKTQYYRATTSAPYHNAVQTETSNVMHFNESTEQCQRTMSVQQTTKVIKFGGNQKQTSTTQEVLEPFPFKVEPERSRRGSAPPPPKPKKFVPGEFRESDYESEVENTRIKSRWGSSEEPHYKKVRAPAAVRSSSVPASREQQVVTPMEFDTQPPYISQSNQIVKKNYDSTMTKQTASKIASQYMDNMTHTFKSKAHQFASDIMDDVNKKSTQKPILKTKDESDAQVYREETRASQYGTKHVDPDTGLIYFKYDFGYEFGILLPGESKNGEIPFPKKTIIQPPQRSQSIEMPVHHETSTAPKKFVAPSTNKNVKWEPTSESEMSEYEPDGRRRPKWDQSSCSPTSISPSLPSTSPAFNNYGSGFKDTETPPSCPSTPGFPQNAQIKRAPVFITPLRDIAVVSGQTARFECIVQSEPSPNVLWSKNGRIIENSNDHSIFFRNGVCRLTIPKTYPEDAGTYTCTATNQVGAINTTATLQVPGERRSSYIK
ncbi:PREDICTED: titin [Nicrophorus vespilloides]|uniref:Titin n=1 Tax=Nicrophorus vespilloides TaxID=110193 RepID=A0ABM1MKC7_NICVS|nr:PREDICTED: titin [Nicrophorus vespilloides]